MVVTIIGHDKSNPNSCITLSINETTPENRSCAYNYPEGSMQVKMVVDGKSFYEGILQHHVRNEDDKKSNSGTTVV